MTEKEFLMQFVMRQYALGFLFTNCPEPVYDCVIDDFLEHHHRRYEPVEFKPLSGAEKAQQVTMVYKDSSLCVFPGCNAPSGPFGPACQMHGTPGMYLGPQEPIGGW